MQHLELIMQGLSLATLAFSLVFMLGIIWRVEMELDIAYKIFFVALLFLLGARILEFFVAIEYLAVIKNVFYFLSSLFLLVGVLTMRNLLRKIDGETDKDE